MRFAHPLRRACGFVWFVATGLMTLASTAAEPYFTLQPKIQTVPWGGTATFSANATGPEPINYQWHKNGAPIDGATNKTLILTNVQPGDQGGYSVVIQDGTYSFESIAAPLVIADQVGWRWATRVGGTENDSALGVDVGTNGIWVSGEFDGQFVRKYSPTTGAKLVDYPISSTGDGAAGLHLDGAGHILLGANVEITSPVYSRPGLLQMRDVDGGGILWSKSFATEKGGTTTPNGYADGLAVAPDGNGNIIVAGYYQGRGKFGSIVGGTIGNEGYCGFVAKYDSDGVALWMRDVKSDGDADDCIIKDMVVDNLGDIYVAGVLGTNGRIQRTATTTDRTASLANTYRRPFVAKYSTAGTLAWTYTPDEEGEFLSVAADAAGNIWTTGYVGSKTDITSRAGLLAKLNRSNGAVIQSANVDDVTGCAIRTQGVSVVWLAMDATGGSTVDGVRWGTTGYRCFLMPGLSLDLDNLTWEVPAFGGLGARSEEADAVVSPDGSVSVVLNFTQTDAAASAEFPKRASFPLTGRARDGIVAHIGELPQINSEPASKLVAKGTEAVMEIAIGGVQNSSIQWYKGTAKLTGETYTDVTYSSTQLTDAGTYFARVTKGGTSIDSDTVYLGVVDIDLPDTKMAIHKKLTLTCNSAGSDLTYVWLKNDAPLNADTRVVGVNAKTLVINDLVPPDAGNYKCVVTGPGGTITTNESIITPVVPPAIGDFSFPASMTSGSYLYTAPFLNSGTKYVITGLPPGMTYSTTTGAISGRPTKPGSYFVKITVTNLAGTYSRTQKMVVAALPSHVTGKHNGKIVLGTAGHPTFGLGGKWYAEVLANGTYTGVVCLGMERLPISGRVTINNTAPYSPQIIYTITRTGGRPDLDLTINLQDTHVSTGTLAEDGGDQVNISGWHKLPATVGRPGTYNYSIAPLTSDNSKPQGFGFGCAKVLAAGDVTITGRLADDTIYTSAGFVGPSGQLLVWQPLYNAGSGIILGVINIVEDAPSLYKDNHLAGSLSWARGTVAGSRFTPATFAPINVSVDGGKHFAYTTYAMGVASGVNNAKFLASDGGLSSPLAVTFSLTSKNIAVMPLSNPTLLNVKVDPLTGVFTGSFTLNDADPYFPGSRLLRPTAFKGIIHLTASGARRGFGYFVLDQLPDANANPPTTINTSPRLSGSVNLGPTP